MEWLQENLLQPLRDLTLAQCLWALSVGVLGGLMPIPMLTTLATLALAKLCRLPWTHIAISSTINFLLTPVQLLFIIPFAQLGRVVCTPAAVASLSLLEMLSDGSTSAANCAGDASLDPLHLSSSAISKIQAAATTAGIATGSQSATTAPTTATAAASIDLSEPTLSCEVYRALSVAVTYLEGAVFSYDSIIDTMHDPILLLQTSGGVFVVGTLAWIAVCVVALLVVVPILLLVLPSSSSATERVGEDVKKGDKEEEVAAAMDEKDASISSSEAKDETTPSANIDKDEVVEDTTTTPTAPSI